MVEAQPQQKIIPGQIPRQRETIVITCAMEQVHPLIITPETNQRSAKAKAKVLQDLCRRSFLGGGWKCPHDCGIGQATE